MTIILIVLKKFYTELSSFLSLAETFIITVNNETTVYLGEDFQIIQTQLFFLLKNPRRDK